MKVNESYLKYIQVAVQLTEEHMHVKSQLLSTCDYSWKEFCKLIINYAHVHAFWNLLRLYLRGRTQPANRPTVVVLHRT